MGRHEGRLDAWHGSVWPARCILASPPATAAVQPARTVPGAASPAPPGRPAVSCPGHLFPPKPVAGSGETLRPAGIGPRDDAIPPRCGSPTRPAHVALLRLELRFYAPPGATHVCQGLQGRILRIVGQVVAGFAAVQVPAVNGPGDFAGLAPAGWTHPLRAEPAAAGTLASLGHRNLTPGLLRQFTAALLHGPPRRSAAARPPAWACGGARSPDAPEMLRTGPGWLQRPDRGAAGNVQHLAHPQRRQSLPEGRPHPEGVVPSNPSGPQMSPLQGPLHHLQRQLGLRPVALPLLRNPRRLTPVLVRGPAFRQIKPLVHQGPSQRGTPKSADSS